MMEPLSVGRATDLCHHRKRFWILQKDAYRGCYCMDSAAKVPQMAKYVIVYMICLYRETN